MAAIRLTKVKNKTPAKAWERIAKTSLSFTARMLPSSAKTSILALLTEVRPVSKAADKAARPAKKTVPAMTASASRLKVYG